MTTSDQLEPRPSQPPAGVGSPLPSVGAPAAPAGAPLPPVGTSPVGTSPTGVPLSPLGAPRETVSRGIAFASGAIPLGMLVAVVVWKLGFIGSISSFIVAGAAVALYTKGAEAPPRQGLVPLVVLIVVGVAASFFAIVASDLVEYHGTPDGQALGYPSTFDFVQANLFNVELLKSYGRDLAMFVVFGTLGVIGTLRRLAASRKA